MVPNKYVNNSKCKPIEAAVINSLLVADEATCNVVFTSLMYTDIPHSITNNHSMYIPQEKNEST